MEYVRKIIIILFFKILVVSSLSANDFTQLLTREERRWLDSNPVVKISLEPDYAPFDFTLKGEPAGYSVDLIVKLCEIIGLDYEFVNDSWGTLLNDTINNEIDILISAILTEKRKELLYFSKPYIHDTYALYINSEASVQEFIRKHRNFNFSLAKGDAASEIIDSDYNYKSFDGYVDTLLDVSNNKKNVAYLSSSVARYYLKSYDIVNLVEVSTEKIPELKRTATFHYGFSKKKIVLRNIIDKAMDYLDPSYYEYLNMKWFLLGGFDVLSNVSLSPEEIVFLKNKGRLVVGAKIDSPPFDILSYDGKYIGYNSDLLVLMKNLLQIEIVVVTGEEKDLLSKLKNGKIDCVIGLSDQSDRDDFLLSSPYINIPDVLISKRGSNFKFDDLSNLSLAMTEVFRSRYRFNSSVKVFEFADSFSLIEAVSKKNVDAAIVSLSSYYYYKTNYNIYNTMISDFSDSNFLSLHFAFQKSDQQLKNIVDSVLVSIPDVQWDSLYQEWINSPQTKFEINLTQEEEAWLRSREKIILASDAEWAPMEYLDDQGNLAGITGDYIKIISEILEIDFEVYPVNSWDEYWYGDVFNKIDLFSAVSYSRERADTLAFSDIYYSVPIMIFSRADRNYVGSLDNLKGKSAIVVKGYIIGEFLKKDYPEIRLVYADNIADALKKLSEGAGDVLVENVHSIAYYQSRLGYHNIVISGETGYSYDNCMGAPKEKAILVGIIDKALKAIPDYEKNRIAQRWINLDYDASLDFGMLFSILIPIMFLLIIAVIWVNKLKIEIQKRKKIERDLLIARDDARTANSAKSEFLANMSHEIRTPMNAIIGFSSILEQTNLDDQQRQYLEYIKSGGNSLLTLINDILDLSKIEAGKIEITCVPVNIRDFFLDIKNLFESKVIDKKLYLDLHISNSNPEILLLDESRLRQILVNLIGNAIKFTDKGGITVVVDSVLPSASTGFVNFSVKVIDTGIGIPRDSIEKIFDAFEQSRDVSLKRHSGTGLGLTISRRLATMMEGQITVESEEGKGSEFLLSIPNVEITGRIEDLDTAEGVEENIEDRLDFVASKILLVDDIKYNREIIKKYLENQPFYIVEAENGIEALDLVYNGAPDLILLDMKMPQMDGYKVAEILKSDKKYSLIPIVAVTASALKQDEDEIKKFCDDYIRKPVLKRELLEKLVLYLKQR
ncbi:MAG: transporter substrate-binding domain-containing protein [Spirochaetales bacterium]|nr:transporter substrate-binding domain-containing protein [Spirochaetales bacterium]